MRTKFGVSLLPSNFSISSYHHSKTAEREKEWASLKMVGNIGSTENIVWDFRL
jgi:hypothetical protein